MLVGLSVLTFVPSHAAGPSTHGPTKLSRLKEPKLPDLRHPTDLRELVTLRNIDIALSVDGVGLDHGHAFELILDRQSLLTHLVYLSDLGDDASEVRMRLRELLHRNPYTGPLDSFVVA